ncbi:MAG: glycosyltransferase family 1 protein [Phormidesmis sp.]
MLVNLAYLLNRPTGTTNYALNLLPYLDTLSPTYLATSASGLTHYTPVPDNMTAADGIAGHLRRLRWTQFNLKKYCKTQSSALFSPIPEAPLFFSAQNRPQTVVTFHDLTPLRFPDDFGGIKFFFRYYVPQVLAQAEAIICDSEASARDVVTFYGIPARKLISIPLAHDHQHFCPTSALPQLPGEKDLTSRPYFLMLGRQAPHKNLGRVIAAMSSVPSEFSLLIAGPSDPRYTPRLKAQADELGVRSQVKFLDYVPYDQLPALLSHAHALVFPSLWEGFGLPVLEAMACGTPVITTCTSSLPEVVGDAALLIDPYDSESIAAAMNQVCHDSSLREQLSTAGLARAQSFSWQATGQATVEVLSHVLGKS